MAGARVRADERPETPEGNLVAGMNWLQGTYTQRPNARHEVFGHLFQGRRKAVLGDGGVGGDAGEGDGGAWGERGTVGTDAERRGGEAGTGVVAAAADDGVAGAICGDGQASARTLASLLAAFSKLTIAPPLET